MLDVGKVTVAGQAAYIDRDGVHVATSPVVGAGVIVRIADDGERDAGDRRHRDPHPRIRSRRSTRARLPLAPVRCRSHRSALFPPSRVPGVPALEIPGAPPVILGTPDLPTRIEVLIGEARVGANATSVLATGEPTSTSPPSMRRSDTTVSGDSFTDVTGPGSSLEGSSDGYAVGGRASPR